VFGDAAGVQGEEVGHRLVGDVNAVDEDAPGDSLAAVARGHLGSDPTPSEEPTTSTSVSSPSASRSR
jgi:hypothetical protein